MSQVTKYFLTTQKLLEIKDFLIKPSLIAYYLEDVDVRYIYYYITINGREINNGKIKGDSVVLLSGRKMTIGVKVKKMSSNEAEEAVSVVYFISSSLRICYWYQISKA
jgi:hypothetical protein